MSAFAQLEEALHRQYSTLDGLSSNEVYDVMCDRMGFMWFATNKGVCRYDGHTFLNYSSEDGLGDNSVLGLFEDYQGRIWCRTISGIVSYIQDERVFTLEARTRISYPNSIYVGEDDVVRIGCQEGGVTYQISPPYTEHNVIIERDTVHDLRVVRYPDGYYFSRSGYYKTNVIEHTEGKVSELKMQVSSSGSKVRCQGDMVVFTTGNSLVITRHGIIEGEYDLPEEIINAFIDEDRAIWICCANSAAVYRLIPGQDLDAAETYIHGHAVSDVQRDLEGGYWFSTVNEGVFYVPDLSIYRLKTEDTLSGSIYIYGDDRNLVATDYEQNVLLFGENGYRKILCTDVISNPGLSPQGVFPVLKRKAFIQFTDSTEQKVAPSGDFLRFFEKADLLIQKSTNSALGALPLLCFEVDLSNHNLLHTYRSPTRINSFCASGDSLILGCVDGLYAFHSGKFSRIDEGLPQIQTRIDDVKMDHDGILWMATAGKGLFFLNGRQLYAVTKENGLSSNVCSRLRNSPEGMLVANDKGLDLIKRNDLNEVSVSHLSSLVGLQGRAIQDFVMWGKTIISTTEFGLLKFDFSTRKAGTWIPKIYLTGVNVRDRDVFSDTSLVLKHHENDISFQFIAPVFRNSSVLMYRYRLLGIDENWHYTAYPLVQYPSLPPGQYIFEVQAVLPEGLISEAAATYSFRIDAPYWKRWWFVLGAVLLIASLVLLTVYLRIRNIKLQSQERERTQLRIAAVEMKAFRAQMNPHFIFNCINSIQHFILENDQMKAHKQLTKFSRLVRNVLENSDMEWITVERELETLKLYIELEAMRFNSSFQYDIEVDASVNVHTDQIPPLVIQPFVENAILHGLVPLKRSPGYLKILMSKRDDIMVCVIEDNGIGRDRAMEIKSRKSHGRKSMGIDLTLERINRYVEMEKLKIFPIVVMKDKFTEDGQPAGTVVTLQLPIQTNKT
ncbi:MAG: histidine kinase [Flavobacteriales bacterium]|nr:histidine kinase [Flavobacteriales bacterium]